jgi:hypothetical protein
MAMAESAFLQERGFPLQCTYVRLVQVTDPETGFSGCALPSVAKTCRISESKASTPAMTMPSKRGTLVLFAPERKAVLPFST